MNRLAVVPSAGGAPRLLTASLDRAVDSPVWTADGSAVLVVVEDDRVRYLARVSAAGGRLEPLTSGRRVVTAPATPDGGKTIAVLSSTAAEPADVYALEGTTLRKLTAVNPWLSEVRLSSVEDVTFTARDGTVVHGLVAKPPAYEAGRRHAAILLVHGGPNGQDEHAFNVTREELAANGFVVLQVNYRGSSGRGSAFQKAIYQDWGHFEVVDLLAGADYVVASGLADPARLGIGGWSYGGILTNYTIATDPRFKAAVSGASSSLQFSIYGTDQYIVQYEQEMGQPWKAFDRWVKVSYPFFQVEKIKTPTLFLGGEKDFNVPIAGTEQMYQALRSVGVETQLVVYPGQFHGLTVPSYLRDRLERYIDWFGRHLGPVTPAPSAPGGER
jgi:dipeptidyl aminopeptidase/acylaminoacyl peptidase